MIAWVIRPRHHLLLEIWRPRFLSYDVAVHEPKFSDTAVQIVCATVPNAPHSDITQMRQVVPLPSGPSGSNALSGVTPQWIHVGYIAVAV
jgi:hypothetical protein